MAFAGMAGIDIKIVHKGNQVLDVLFSEEVGWILEVEDLETTLKTFASNSVPAFTVGKTTNLGLREKITIEVAGQQVLHESVFRLMRTWEETSAQLEKRQSNVSCAEEEFLGLETRKVPIAKLTFDPDCWVPKQTTVRVAVIREEGINGDREMAAACIQAGFETWDVTVTDLLNGQVTLDRFRGVIFPGGFSYADVLGSAKGWAAKKILDKMAAQKCVALKYVDDDGTPTEKYPMNPNGSKGGVAGVCSEDGRHLAMMPHPERCTQMWQWPYIPVGWKNETSPWLRIFQNAFDWCLE
ncbi:GSCOCG00009622001-RA-CDS [Cotesia congregata]|nr:GSCOCG00009622001-RA-CDS [Cotesia congregata]